MINGAFSDGVPKGIRTPVTAVKERHAGDGTDGSNTCSGASGRLLPRGKLQKLGAD
jgi:hypothetical protein